MKKVVKPKLNPLDTAVIKKLIEQAKVKKPCQN
jgi:hypothetical protein